MSNYRGYGIGISRLVENKRWQEPFVLIQNVVTHSGIASMRMERDSHKTSGRGDDL